MTMITLNDADRRIARALGLSEAEALENKRAEYNYKQGRAVADATLTAAEKRMCSMLGTDPVAFVEAKQAELARNIAARFSR